MDYYKKKVLQDTNSKRYQLLIYEGTNEINRMLLVGMILKRAMKGKLDIMKPAMQVASCKWR